MKVLGLFILTFGLIIQIHSEAAENVICKKCDCDKDTKVIGCSNKGLTKMFSYEDWMALNDSDVKYETLRLDHNKLEVIDVSFPELQYSLKKIDFSHNKISKVVGKLFYNMTDIEEVNFSFNDLKKENFKPEVFEGRYAAGEFDPLMKLKRLDLSHNAFIALDAELFEHTKHLQELRLNDNPMQILHPTTMQALADLQQLQFLDLSRMELEDIPAETLHPLQALNTLRLDGNLFSKIPSKAFRFSKNLRDLSLSDNPIGDLIAGENYLSVPSLQRLNLTYMMSMTSIGPGSLKGLENLSELHISNNHHLSFIDVLAFQFPEKDNMDRTQWPPVKKLFLENNNLTTLDNMMLLHWDELEEVHIHDNPWLCDCEIEWFIDILMPIISKKSPHMIEHIKCSEPSPMADKNLKDLSETHYELRCLDKYGAHPERDSALLVALLIGVLLGIPLTFAAILIFKRSCKRHQTRDYSRAFYTRASSQDIFTP